MNLIQHVLVIEDEADSRSLMTRLFQFHGIKVTAAATGEEALKALENLRPNLIIVDLALPSMDGWTVLKRLKANTKLAHIPVIAITAFHTAELAQEAIRVGFNAYFAKPLNVMTFIPELEELVKN
jgi:hypothetical protein